MAEGSKLEEVRPGDLIEADLINAIIVELKSLKTRLGTIVMPSLFGLKAGQVLKSRDMLMNANLGKLITADGIEINLQQTVDKILELLKEYGLSNRKIIGQEPVAGMPINKNSVLNLLLASKDSN